MQTLIATTRMGNLNIDSFSTNEWSCFIIYLFLYLFMECTYIHTCIMRITLNSLNKNLQNHLSVTS